MHKFIFYNGKIIPNADARIRAVSVAALYGKSIFTTIAVYDKKLFLWQKHWRRLITNSLKIGLDLAKLSEESLKNSLTQLIEKNESKTARARITLFDESPNKIWSSDVGYKTSLLIQIADFRPIKESFSLAVSPFLINSTSPLAGIKSGNYMENIIALENAKSKNFDETIRLNERGEVVSACLANIFWLKNKKLFTPNLETGCLAGTTREFVMENTKVFEVAENLETLQNADTIFLTSAGIGIVQASRLQIQDKTKIFAASNFKVPDLK